MSNLIARTILGFAFLMLILALALFIPAGTLGYWQAQLYLADFALCTILITVYLAQHDRALLEGRVKGGPTAETQRGQQIIQSLASLSFLAMFIVSGLDFRLGWSHISPILSLIGDGFVALGFYMVFLVFRVNSYTRATIEVSADQKVISTGPYALVRHPMYSGASILVIFTPIALGSWVALPFAVLLIVVVALRAVDEERFLAANLSGYEQYRQTVRYRLIPFVW